jgi:uncharacterized membrane protein
LHRFVVLVATLVAVAWFAPAAFATPQLQIVSQNPDYLTLAVDHQGVTYGEPVPAGGVYASSIYRSTDEGQTWTHLFDFPSSSHVYAISVLGDDTLLAHVDTGAMNLYRSADGGVTWARVLTMPTTPVFYTTLTSHSVTDLMTSDGRYVFVGSYNTGDSGNHTNYIWRSGDDGQTWTLVYTSTTHRHIHFVQANPYADEVYVAYGDGGSQVSIERSTDHGLTWTPICSGDPCTAVDMAFDSGGFSIFGQDRPFTTSYIEKMDLATGTLTQVTPLPGPSYSALHLSPSVWLIGETHEPNLTDDGNVHLFASDNGGRSFVDVHQWPYASAGSYARMYVQFAYPNGDFSIRIEGYGTIVGRIVGSPAPDFALAASPGSRTVTAGTGTTYDVAASATGGFAGSVGLSVSGLPSGASATFTPASINTSGDSTLSVTTGAATSAGTYTLTITGTSGGTTHTTTASLTVTAAPDFGVTASPGSRSIAAGSPASFSVSVGSVAGFAASVALSVSGLPTGATGTFTPATLTAPGTSSLAVTTSRSTPVGTYTLTITGTSGGTTHTTTVSLTITAAPDFGVAATPGSQSTAAGSPATYSVSVGSIGGFAGSVGLSVSGLPTGATGTFTPATVTVPGSSSLAVTTSRSTPVGTYTLTITGASGGTAHATTVSLTVTAAPDFSLDATPAARSVVAGASSGYTTSIASIGGFGGSVALAVSGLPSGASGTFTPASPSAPGSSSLAVTTGPSTPAGTYTLTITGTSGSLTHSTTVQLTITPAPDFSVSASPATQTVTAGSSAGYAVSVGSVGGFGGTVALSVSGVPANASASFSPAGVGAPDDSTLTVQAGGSTPAGFYTLTITATSGGTSHSTTVGFKVTAPSFPPAAPGFSVAASPGSQSVVAGSAATYTVLVGASGSFGGTVGLSVAGLPAGATASFSPATVAAASAATLVVSSTAATPAGTYTLTITASSGSTSHTATVTLVIAPPPDFTLKPEASARTVWEGKSASVAISVGATGGFSGAVGLSVEGLPAGITAVLAPTSITGSGMTNLTLKVGLHARPGRYTLAITGSSASLTHTVQLTLVVPMPDFALHPIATSRTVRRGGTTTYAVSVTDLGGFSGPVALSVSGLPSGASMMLSPRSVRGSRTLRLTVTASARTPTGRFTITVTATSGKLRHRVKLTLVVRH